MNGNFISLIAKSRNLTFHQSELALIALSSIMKSGIQFTQFEEMMKSNTTETEPLADKE